MLQNVIEVKADDRYKKIFFFQLHLDPESSSGIEFDEDKIHSLIKSKSFEEMTSDELFELCTIGRYEEFAHYLIEKFFFIQREETIENQNIFNHPILYTKIQPIINDAIYEAQIGLNCHLLNKHGEKIFLSCENENWFFNFRDTKVYTITPNLYDNGFYYFKVYSNDLIELIFYDDNNGEGSDLYQLKEETYLLKINEIAYKQSILSIIQQNKNAEIIKFASDELLNDFELMCVCIELDGALLEYASEELQNNVELVYHAVSKDGNSLEFASEELKNDRGIVLSAVQEYPYAIAYASEKLRNDKEIALIVIEKDYGTYIHLGKEIKNDPEIKNKYRESIPPPTKKPKLSVSEGLLKLLQSNDDDGKLNEALDDQDLPF